MRGRHHGTSGALSNGGVGAGGAAGAPARVAVRLILKAITPVAVKPGLSPETLHKWLLRLRPVAHWDMAAAFDGLRDNPIL
jgi:hypothetical protein